MVRRVNAQNLSALRWVVLCLGLYAALLGFEHGFFETLQGNRAPAGIRILASYPAELPFPFGHEPAMTLVPNFLLTGILAMGVSLLLAAWVLFFTTRRGGKIGLLLLSVLLLLVGGGFAPITLLAAVLIASLGLPRPSLFWSTRLPAALRNGLARLWPGGLWLVLAWVPLEFVLGQIFQIKNDPNLSLALTYPLLALLVVCLLAAYTFDASRPAPDAPQVAHAE